MSTFQREERGRKEKKGAAEKKRYEKLMRKEEPQFEKICRRKYDKNFRSLLEAPRLQQCNYPLITELDGPPKWCLVVVIWSAGVDVILFK